ncbi:adenosylmethionine decarboxylase [Pseudomonas gingeri]|uniref:adenosylmethionine decarboxylase n=1 Tax=Pseudomonas gingeri TaxID=117681 RepID=UPI00159FBE3A|nr:adenosylmethionine decarboxylase [Pseudomonas gingeri]NVZ62954.1 adenosylmethionine decarboxylase [Pseudomonas gingeri]NVZ77677.1 adenosylmethionine decarboxylase [Pseudomonas gingeri]NWA03063.1 adenosylmethionine decarboxylase [Pseudomonas gingeri]NWA17212.1 adenosylmethionine decarboxylase [Pseudomonas gingeri]NWA57924.1 adenosylmethionine decarboxylase [Pseudomonas gingeri]
MEDRGYHTIWDITGASAQLLRNDNALHRFFLSTLQDSGFTVISDMLHKFAAGGEGVTGLFLLSESHLSYHTYPESGYISIDVYTCGKKNHSINEGIASFFGNKVQMNRRTLLRGSALSNPQGVAYAAYQ